MVDEKDSDESASAEIPVEIEEQHTVPTSAPHAGAVAGGAGSEPSPADRTDPGDALTALEGRIAALEKDKKETYERLLRTAADLDNFRKRSRKDVDEARLKAREEVLREMLPVLDNLERGLAAAEKESAPGVAPLVDGVKLVLRQAQSALERFEVKGFSSIGEAFDPARHEAISQVETTAHPPGTVCQELQKGYLIGSRLLRPALVAVAKAPPAPEAEAKPDGEAEADPEVDPQSAAPESASE